MAVIGARNRPVCFAHVPVDPGVLDTRLPHALSVATRDGAGWVSMLAMRTRPLAGPVPLVPAYAQLAVRTYVEADGREAVHVLRVDADSGPAARLVRRLFGAAVRHVDVDVENDGEVVRVRTHAPDGELLYAAAFSTRADVRRPEDGSLAAWLTDRSQFALADGRTGAVDHDPWRVAPVSCEVAVDGLLESAALSAPVGEPLYRYSPGVDLHVTRWPGDA